MRATENSWKQGVILRTNFLAAQQQLQLAEARRWFAKNSWNLRWNLIFEVKVVKLLKIDKTWIRIIFQDSSTYFFNMNQQPKTKITVRISSQGYLNNFVDQLTSVFEQANYERYHLIFFYNYS